MGLGLKQSMVKHARENMILYFVVTLFLVIGIFTGVLAVNAIKISQKQELAGYINNFFVSISDSPVRGFAIFKQSLLNNFQFIIAFWILGITIIGIPIILIIISIKGFMLGFTVGFIIKDLGLKGILFAIISILPQNIFILPSLIIVGVISISFSIKILKNRAFKKGFLHDVAMYSLEIITFASLAIGGALIEGYVIPFCIKVFSNYV